MRFTTLALGAWLAWLACLAPAPVSADHGEPIYVLRFTDYDHGSIDDWLQSKGFQFKHDAQRRDRINLDVGANGLVVEAKRRAFGIMPNEYVNVRDFRYVEIDWGVNRFPQGASYEQGIRDEALLVTVFMGDEEQPSGSMFIPDSPHFVGLFLCLGDDRMNHPYLGTYYKQGGRFVCAGKPAEGEKVTTRFDLSEAYRTYFERTPDDAPMISGLALSLDTQESDGDGKTSAFISEIRFYH